MVGSTVGPVFLTLACESLIELDRDTLAYSVGSRPRVAAPEFSFVLSR